MNQIKTVLLVPPSCLGAELTPGVFSFLKMQMHMSQMIAGSLKQRPLKDIPWSSA